MFEQIREFINRGQKAQKAFDKILKDQRADDVKEKKHGPKRQITETAEPS